MTEQIVNNMKTLSIISLTFLFASLFLSGCDFVGNPIEPPRTPGEIKITIFSPSSNDTISYKNQVVNYEVQKDLGFRFIELWIDDKYIQTFFPDKNGVNPIIIMNLNQTLINSKINFHLVYHDQNGNSIKSEVKEQVVVGEERVLPSTPYNVQVNWLSNTAVNLSWNDSTKGDLTYEIWRKINVDGAIFVKHIVIEENNFNVNDFDVNADMVYYYKIKTVNKFGSSEFCPIVNTAGAGGSPNLAPPTNLTAIATGAKVVKLTWKDNSYNENFIKVERKSVYGLNFENVGILQSNSTAFTDSNKGLMPGLDYIYRIKIFSNSDSSWSGEIRVKTPPYTLMPPTINTITNPSSKRTEVKFTDNDLHYAGWVVERKEGSGEFLYLGELDATKTTYVDYFVLPNKSYTYRIKAFDGTYSSAYSNEKSINTIVIPLPAPTINAYYNGTSLHEIRWNYVGDASKYIIERKSLTAGSSYSIIAEVDGSQNLYQDINVQCQHLYSYRVKATDGITTSAFSNEAQVQNYDNCP